MSLCFDFLSDVLELFERAASKDMVRESILTNIMEHLLFSLIVVQLDGLFPFEMILAVLYDNVNDLVEDSLIGDFGERNPVTVTSVANLLEQLPDCLGR